MGYFDILNYSNQLSPNPKVIKYYRARQVDKIVAVMQSVKTSIRLYCKPLKIRRTILPSLTNIIGKGDNIVSELNALNKVLEMDF